MGNRENADGTYRRMLSWILLPMLLLSLRMSPHHNIQSDAGFFVSGFVPDQIPKVLCENGSNGTNRRRAARNAVPRHLLGHSTPPSSRLLTKPGYDDDYDSPDPEDDAQSLARMTPKQREKHALTLQEQAQKLRAEADALRKKLEREKQEKLEERNAKVDRWIERLLIEVQVDETIQLLKSEEEVLRRLKEDRFSHEQVNAIFNRICELGPQSRSNCSPLMELLVDSVGKMDEVDREQNPNKRWSGKVERKLRRRLFAMDWNMDLDESDENDDINPWRLR